MLMKKYNKGREPAAPLPLFLLFTASVGVCLVIFGIFRLAAFVFVLVKLAKNVVGWEVARFSVLAECFLGESLTLKHYLTLACLCLASCVLLVSGLVLLFALALTLNCYLLNSFERRRIALHSITELLVVHKLILEKEFSNEMKLINMLAKQVLAPCVRRAYNITNLLVDISRGLSE